MSNHDPGHPFASPPPAEQIFCPNCNGGNPPGATNCGWCGAKLNAPPVEQAPVTPQPQSYQQPPPHTPAQQPYTPQAPQPYVPQNAQPMTSVTAAPAKPGSGRRTALIIGGVLLGLLLVCGIAAITLFGGIFGGVLAATQPAVDSGDRFMKTLSEGNYDQAFQLCTPSLQTDVGSAAALKSALETRQPVKWTFNSRSINNGLATLSGTTTYAGNESGTVNMELRQVGSDWRVSFVNLK